MKKIFCHVPREDWIVDRMGKEFETNSSHSVSSTNISEDTDIIWLFASWCWNQIPVELLKIKKVVCTIHHEVPWKFDENKRNTFLFRDQFVDYYHTYNQETKDLIQSLTEKPIVLMPHWINDKIWYKKEKIGVRENLKLPKDKFLIGSFQRDTEGSDLISPKLEKGPDILVEKIIEINKIRDDIHVVLAGWRRQYVIKRLDEEKIDYTYLELPTQNVINDLYNSLDLYLISSRCEGGPQSLFEASYLQIPLLSTRAGQFNFINSDCLYEQKDTIDNQKLILAKENLDYNLKSVSELLIGEIVKKYDKFFEGI